MVKKTQLGINYCRLVEHAFDPEYSTDGAAGIDLRCIDSEYNPDYNFVEYGTGLALEIPEGYMGLLFARSSVSKTTHSMANSVGVIDSDYRGEVKFRFRNVVGDIDNIAYGFGEKVGQVVLVPIPKVILTEVDSLDGTVRGDGGFGSTGR